LLVFAKEVLVNKFFLLTFSVFVGLGSAAWAQSPNQRTPTRQPPSAQPGEQQPADPGDGQTITLVGCLAKGGTADQYVITDHKSGRKLSFGGPNELTKYLNQTVQLTGTLSSRNGEQSFQPESLKPISPSCEASNDRQ
jgi:hypothetical protein